MRCLKMKMLAAEVLFKMCIRDRACSAAYAAMQESLAELKQVEKTLNGKKDLQRQVLALSLIHI